MKIAKKITIVGGGTSAWMTAALLVNNISKDCEITLIDKEDGNPVGVGEATILSFKSFMNDCGFDIFEYFKEIDCTFKGGILFENWKGPGQDIWHPFGFPNLDSLAIFEGCDISIHEIWTNYQREYTNKKTDCEIHYNLAVRDNKMDPDNLRIYATHIDAGLLVKYIQRKIKDRITFIQGEVTSKTTTPDGYIESLSLTDGTCHKADLFVDCTGFNGLLKDQDRVDLTDRLFCDTAIAGHVPYIDRPNELKPYTACDAVEHGWIWKIPVSERYGTGLVFNRSITPVEDAVDFFVEYWDKRLVKNHLKVLDWTPFYIRNFWEKNVVNIGLSAGFIEPLESTGIGLIAAGAWELLNRIKTRTYDDTDINLYNSQMTCFFENSVDFVNMHYSRSKNEGKFWQWVHKVYKPTETLKYHADDYAYAMKDIQSEGKEMFSGANWFCWMNQLDYPVCPKDIDIPPHISRDILEKFYEQEELKFKYLPTADVCNDNFRNIQPPVTYEKVNPWNENPLH